MFQQRWNRFAHLPGLLAATLLAVGCGDALSPAPHSPGGPAFVVVSASAAVAGRGAIGDGFSLAVPLMNRQEFDFDVTGTPGGRLFVRDFRDVRFDGSVGSLTADPAVDPATGIRSFTPTSATCVAFGGVARHDSGQLMEFSVDACDNGSPGAGLDSFSISVPTTGYRASGTLKEGEITLSGVTWGDLDVTTVSTGSDLDPDGYTVILDSTINQAVGTNETVRLNVLAEGSHTVELTGVAANCTLSGENRRTVMVVAGSVVSTAFELACVDRTVVTQVTGRGALGDGLAVPTMDRFEFDFEATSNLTGRMVVTEYRAVRADGSPARMVVDPATDPETGITSFGQTSAACVRFGGVGRINEGDRLYQFFVDACDNASPGVNADTFAITLPDRPYSRSGTLTEGDIAIRTF